MNVREITYGHWTPSFSFLYRRYRMSNHDYLHDSHAGEGPCAAGGQNIAVSPAHPLHNGSSVLNASAAELVVADIVGNGVGLCQQGAILALESWNLNKKFVL